jgi:multiple sugar transport system permease protein
VSRRGAAEAVMVNALLALLAALTLFPLAWMLSVSFMRPGEAGTFPPPLWPSAPTLANYRELLTRQGLGRAFLNSLVVASAAAKLRFAGRERLLRSLIALMVVPAQTAMIPLFLLLKAMGLVNSYAGVVLPTAAGAFGIFLVRQYALAIPDELLEAARMDGAGEWRIFRSIVLPLLAPVLVTLALFAFLGAWNDFLWPLIVLSDDRRYTLPVALAALSREHVQDSALMMAGAAETTLPVLLLFLLLQRYYLRGLVAGALKG